MKTSILLCVLAVLVVPNLSSANISGPFTTTTPIPSTLTDWTGSLAFPQFNPGLGTLTEVKLDLQGSFSTILTVTNESPLGSSGTAKTELQMTVQDAGNNLIAPELDLFSPNFAYSLGAGESVTSGTLTKNGSSSDLYTLAAVLTEFTGAGSIVLPASTFTQTWLTNTGGNTYATQVTNAQLTGTVTYTYIPEPVSLSMLGLGAVALIRRRR